MGLSGGVQVLGGGGVWSEGGEMATDRGNLLICSCLLCSCSYVWIKYCARVFIPVVSKLDAQKWCLENGFELVELNPEVDSSDSEEGTDRKTIDNSPSRQKIFKFDFLLSYECSINISYYFLFMQMISRRQQE